MAAILIALLCCSLIQRIVFTLASLIPGHRRPPMGDWPWPSIQIFVAARDEEAALPALLGSLERLDYFPEKLSFCLVSDGSVDSTAELFERWCRERPNRRTIRLDRPGGKAAALKTAWEASTGSELTALYDADVQPAASALRMLAEEFADARVGAAAGAVMPSNSPVNSIARYAALELYVFHQVIQRARHRLGLNPPTVGANCVYRTAALAGIGGFPQDELSEDVATSFDLIARGWRTSFRPDAVVTTNVPTTLDQFWRQRQRWTRGLSRAAGRAPGPSALLVASGYADRLVFLAALVAALSGSLSWFWPCLYFAGPGLNICIALQRAHVSGRILLFVGCLPMFALDVCATLSGTLASLWASKPGWTTRTLT